MQRIAFGVVLGAMLAASSTVLAQAPSWTPPPENQRCPSKWGADDGERRFRWSQHAHIFRLRR